MPELPEVETVVRSLAPRLVGRSIQAITTTPSRVFRGQQQVITSCLPGQQIHAVERYGKNILVTLDRHRVRIHLGMTGKLLFAPARATHPRAMLALDDGLLVFDDIRQFGRFELLPADDGGPALGPDALAIAPSDFLAMLRSRRGAVKNVLMNQSFLRGMGNIYTDEALFEARIHPLCPAYRVSRPKALSLHAAMQALLLEAISAGGSSIADYVDADGLQGSFQNRHQVYGRDGTPCPRCATPLRRVVVCQRGTHYCPRCQRMPATRADIRSSEQCPPSLRTGRQC
jgi:formamidopyrimidine-DNA glycosylase